MISVTPGSASRVRDGDGVAPAPAPARSDGWGFTVGTWMCSVNSSGGAGESSGTLNVTCIDAPPSSSTPRVYRGSLANSESGGVVGGDPGVQSLFAPRDDFGPCVSKEEGRSRQGGAAAAQDGVPRAPIGHRAKPRGGHEHDGRPRNVRVGDQAARKLVQRPERLPRAFRIRRERAEPGLDAHHAELLRVAGGGPGATRMAYTWARVP